MSNFKVVDIMWYWSCVHLTWGTSPQRRRTGRSSPWLPAAACSSSGLPTGHSASNTHTHTHVMQSESTRGSCGAGTDQRASSCSPRQCGGRAWGAADRWPRPRWPAHSLTSSSCGARSAGQNERQSMCWEINGQTSCQKIQELELDQNKCCTSSGA